MWQPATVPLRIDDDGGNGNDLLNAVFDGSYTDTVNGGGGIDEGHLDTGLDTNPLNDIENLIWDA